jgi:hypothetical protein
MTLRIPQQQQPIERSAVADVTATAAAAAAAECAASSGATSDSGVSSCDENSSAPVPRMYRTVLEATAAEDEHALRTKHILVSKDPILKFAALILCALRYTRATHTMAYCVVHRSSIVYDHTVMSVSAHARDAVHHMHRQYATYTACDA